MAPSPEPVTPAAPAGSGGRTDRSARRFWPIVGGLVAVAAAVRTAAIIGIGHASAYGFPGGDGFYYAMASESVIKTGTFGIPGTDGTVLPDVLHPPLWTAYLALARFLGATTLDRMRFAGALLGLVTVVLVALAGRRLLSARTGLVAAAVVAISPAFWGYERNLNSEAITFPLVAATILLAYRYLDRRTLGRCLALTAVLGLLTLARSEQAIVAAALLVPLVLGTRSLDLAHRIGRLALAGALFLAVISPWTIFNLGNFENPVLLSSGSGNAMLAGSCDTTFSGDLIGGFDENCNRRNPVIFQAHDRTVLDGLQRSAALDYWRDHAGQLPMVVVAREGRAWAFYDVGDQNTAQAYAIDLPSGWIWAQTVLFWITVPLAVVGAVLLRRRGTAVYPLLLFPAVAVVSVAITFGDIRYRAAAEIPLLLLAAAAIDLLVARQARSTDARADEEPRGDGAAEPVAAAPA